MEPTFLSSLDCLIRMQFIENNDDMLVNFVLIYLKALPEVSSHSLLMLFSFTLPYREISDNLGQPVNCISMSNDGNCILASCLDSTLRLLDR